MILMLEDDADRIRRFTAAPRAIDPKLLLMVRRDAYRMSREVGDHLPAALPIAPDHDLEPRPDEPSDLGDGLVGAKALASYPRPCPVIIHSSNGIGPSGWRASSSWWAPPWHVILLAALT